MVSIDIVDKMILDTLSRNGRASAAFISGDLAEKNITLSARSVLNRITKMEKFKIIQGYTVILSPATTTKIENKIVLLKFDPQSNGDEIKKLVSYLCQSSFCQFAAQLSRTGDQSYDYVFNLVFDTEKQFDSQLDIIRNTFGNLIFTYHISNARFLKQTPNTVLSNQASPSEGRTAINKRLTTVPISLSQIMDDIAKDLMARHFEDSNPKN